MVTSALPAGAFAAPGVHHREWDACSAFRSEGRQDPRDRQAPGSGRNCTCRERLRSGDLAVLGGVHAVRLRLILQSRRQAYDDAVLAVAQAMPAPNVIVRQTTAF